MRRRKPSLLAVILTLAVAVIVFAVGLHTWLVEHALDTRGVSAMARVTGGEHTTGKHGHTYLRYQFTANDTVYTGRSNVTVAYYRAVHVGDTIPVVYLPESPSTSRCPEATGYSVAYVSLVTGIVLLVVAAIFALQTGFKTSRVTYRTTWRIR